MIIIVDSDGLIGLSNEKDVHYANAINILQKLNKKEAKFIYPSTVIAEATTLLQIRLNKSDIANRIIELVKSEQLIIEPVDQTTLINASLVLEEKRNKHITMFDAIVFVAAQKYKADAIFSFDHFYKTKGFKLAGELE